MGSPTRHAPSLQPGAESDWPRGWSRTLPSLIPSRSEVWSTVPGALLLCWPPPTWVTSVAMLLLCERTLIQAEVTDSDTSETEILGPVSGDTRAGDNPATAAQGQLLGLRVCPCSLRPIEFSFPCGFGPHGGLCPELGTRVPAPSCLYKCAGSPTTHDTHGSASTHNRGKHIENTRCVLGQTM